MSKLTPGVWSKEPNCTAFYHSPVTCKLYSTSYGKIIEESLKFLVFRIRIINIVTLMCADIWGCESHKMIYIKHHLINITYCHHPVIIWERKQRKVMGEIINSFLSGSVALKFSLFLSSFESSEECVYLFLLFL